ncbi:hypothetical protein D3C75_1297690 [compost metagenome]
MNGLNMQRSTRGSMPAAILPYLPSRMSVRPKKRVMNVCLRLTGKYGRRDGCRVIV